MDCPWEIRKEFTPIESKLIKGTPGKPPVGFSCMKFTNQPDQDAPTNYSPSNSCHIDIWNALEEISKS